MPFPQTVRIEALVACQRQCCLCHQRKHTRMQCHHIVQEADGGANTFENCIPLCPDCHAEVKAFDPHHPFGATPYSSKELIRRRDDWYAIVAGRTAALAEPLARNRATIPFSTPLYGRAEFAYTSHNGFYRLGEGNHEFLTRWSTASQTAIHAYTDATNARIAVAASGQSLNAITSASTLDFSSRVRTVQLREYLILENHVSHFAAIQPKLIQVRTRGDVRDWLVFDYWILETGSDDFSEVVQ